MFNRAHKKKSKRADNPSKEVFFQAKLRINDPGDHAEQEAETRADQVVQGKQPNLDAQPLPLTRKAADAGFVASAETATGIDRIKGGGNALPADTLGAMNQSFGTDFSGVRIHTGSQAEQLNQGIRARAFTHGEDIFFDQGQYNPGSADGKHLLAHELTHVVQQRTGAPAIMRAVTDAEVETEYTTWATANSKTTDKTKEQYAFDLWEFIRPQLMDESMKIRPKPADAKKLADWTKNFEKAEVIARWLLQMRSGAKSDDIKSTADSKALMVLDAMTQAGFVTQAMAQAGGLSDERKKLLYDSVMKNPAAATASDLETITTFQCNGVSDPASVPMVKDWTDGQAHKTKALDLAQSKAILKTLIKKYGSHATIIDAVAELLVFNPAIRNGVSDAMMSSEFGTPELLFKVLQHKLYIEPGYGADLINVPADKTPEAYDAERMTTMMPWVYTYKQKYYVQFLIDLAKGEGITIAPPTSMDFAGLKTWLEANTDKIGQAAKTKYAANPNDAFALYKNIADIFFYHIPHTRDVAPDLEGKISHLKEGTPAKKRFEADCDVFATYAMRLFFNAGFEPVGYLAFVPSGDDSSRAAHVTALIRKNNAYYIINNKGILDAAVTETTANEKKLDALKSMRAKAFSDAYGDPLPTDVKIYYADALDKGKMPLLFKNQDSSLERTDL